MKRLMISAALAALTVMPAFAADLMAMNPFAYATSASAKAGGAYVSVMSHGEADRLIGARADIAKRVEIHIHIKDGDVMRMRRVETGVELPAGGVLEMGPGGVHIMLMGLVQPLETGASFPVTLEFESGAELVVDVPVKARGDHTAGHNHSGHGSSSD